MTTLASSDHRKGNSATDVCCRLEEVGREPGLGSRGGRASGLLVVSPASALLVALAVLRGAA